MSPYRWRVGSVLVLSMVVMPFFDTSVKSTLIDHTAGVCFLLAAVLIEYYTHVMTKENPINAISILLIPILLLIILSIVGIMHFIPAFVIYGMGSVVAGGYPGRQAMLPNTSIEWAKLIATLFLITFFMVLVIDTGVQKAVFDFISFISKQL